MRNTQTNRLYVSLAKIVPIFLPAIALSLFSITLSANEWDSSLGPSFPEDTQKLNRPEEDFAPAAIPNSYSAKQLPARITQRGGRLAAFQSPPEPGAAIIPQSFFDETPASETSSASPTPSVPKSLKKKAPILETDPNVMAVPADASAGTGTGEFTFNDESIASFSGVQDNTVYNESFAMNGYYAGPMMMKPFGTGMMDNVTIFGGATGFKNRLDGGRNGNFGFQEGINWAGPATPQCTVSGQVGFRAVQSNLNGNSGVSSKKMREQYFVTAGLFKRDLCYPIQGGVAFDWMEDDFYGKVKVRQFRCELAARTFSNLEYGFQGGFGVSKKGNDFIDRREDPLGLSRYGIEAQQYYLLFVRKHFPAGGVAELRVGMTEWGDTILSGTGEFPLNDRLTLNGGFTGLIPETGRGRDGYRQESWELSVGFVFYFRGGACSKPCNPCRAMFDVAGNGSFFNRIVRK